LHSNSFSSSSFTAFKCQVNPLHRIRVIARHRRARRRHQSRPIPMSNKLLVDYFRQNRSKCPTPTLQYQTLLIVSVRSLVRQAMTTEGKTQPSQCKPQSKCTLRSTIQFNARALIQLSFMTPHMLLPSPKKSTATAFWSKLDLLSTSSLNKRDTTMRLPQFDRVNLTPGSKTLPTKPNNRGSRATKEQLSSRNATPKTLSRHC